MRLVFSSDATLPEKLTQLLQENSSALTGFYPPAEFFASGVLGDVLFFLLFAGISLGVFAAAVALISWKYIPICQAMQTHDAKNNYVMTDQVSHSVSAALFNAPEAVLFFEASLLAQTGHKPDPFLTRSFIALK